MANKSPQEIIEVLIAIDGWRIYDLCPKQENPSPDRAKKLEDVLAGRLDEVIVMMTPRRYQVNPSTPPNSNLQLKANTGDNLRWRAADFSEGVTADVVLVKFQYAPGTPDHPLNQPRPQAIEKFTMVPRVKPGLDPDPTDLVTEKHTVFHWEATARSAGTGWYNFVFAVIDPRGPENTRVLGYYYWDPAIVVQN